ERILDGIEMLAGPQPFDCRHAGAVRPDGKREARACQAPIDQDGARPAGTLATALLGPKKAQAITQKLDEGPVRRHVGLDRAAVEVEAQRAHHEHASVSCVTMRRTQTRSMARR